MGKASRKKKGVASSELPVASEPTRNSQVATRNWLIALALFVLVLVVFGRTAWNGYIDFDDPSYVSANAVVQRGLTLDGIKYAFTALTPYYWQPLTWISHEIDAALFGARPGPQHLMSVVLHALTAALLFLFLHRATGRVGTAAAAAAIWAVHPLRVESVAWIAERKDVLSGLFFVATLLAYERYVRQRSPRRYAVVLAMFALALMAKPSVVTAPLVLLLLNFWPFRDFVTDRRRAAVEALAPAVLAIPIVIATVVGQQQSISNIPLSLRLLNAARSAGAYLGKLLVPTDLAIVYPFREDIAAEAAIGGAVVIAISALVWYARTARPYLAVGWGWYLAMLLPVVGLVQSGAQAMADRFTYVPSMGVIVGAVWLVAEWGGALSKPLATVAVLAYAAVSVAYAGVWRDTITLFTHARDVTRDNSLAHLILGNVYLEEKRYDDANAEYADAIRTSHGGAIPLATAGAAFLQQKRYLEAVEPLQRAVDADPNNANVQENLAVALIRTGRAVAAVPHLDAVLRLDPSRAMEVTQFRGEAALATGRLDEAIADFRRVIQTKPDAASWNDLASAYASKNDFADAENAYRQAITFDPNHYDARMNFAAMLSRAGRNDEALMQVRAAARIAPDSIEPRIYLALIEAQVGRKADAANDAAAAQSIDPVKANDYLTNALHIPPKDTNLADFIATMRAR